MIKLEDYPGSLPLDLAKQIEELCALVKEMQGETANIVQQDNLSDASEYLQDVLKSTEEATHAIIDAMGAIQKVSDDSASLAQDKTVIAEHITHVYEACNFQDITGQKIKKILKGIGVLQLSIMKLAQTAKAYDVAETNNIPPDASGKSLLNGPQLSTDAPSQHDIDELFKSF